MPIEYSQEHADFHPDLSRVLDRDEATFGKDAIRQFRMSAAGYGYSLVRVQTAGKRPIVSRWQQGESLEALSHISEHTRNTGMICSGLRVIDVDVDDHDIASKIEEIARATLPTGALVRFRSNSARLALVYRASEGAQTKRTLASPRGKVEVLGAGQQLVVHGLHPSGVPLEWRNELSPALVPLSSLPAVSEHEVEVFLQLCRAELGVIDGVTREVTFPQRTALSNSAAQALAALVAGIHNRHWFDELTSPEKFALVRQCLLSVPNNRVDPRERWLVVLFAVADAGERGCPNARELALAWSKCGASWTSESDFDSAWNSFHSGRTTVGSLIKLAKDAGADLEKYRQTIGGKSEKMGCSTAGSSNSIGIDSIPKVPPKRRWLHGTDAARGAVSLVVAPGGRGKSTWLLTLALACASGRPLLGAHVFGGPVRVLYLNAEDPTAEISRRLRASMQHHGIRDEDLGGLRIAGAEALNFSLLQVVRSQPTLNQPEWSKLIQEIESVKPDLVLVDPLISLMGGVSLNDNSAAALLVGRFVQVAAQYDLSIFIAHHAAKHREANNAEAAMGAASLVNLARICLSIEPLSSSDAPRLGVPPSEAHSVFRILSTKQNLAAPNAGDRWYRLAAVELSNAEPPVYPRGDSVAVVEKFSPTPLANAYPAPVINAALAAIAAANPPLSVRKASTEYAIPHVRAAVASNFAAVPPDRDVKAIIDHLILTGKVAEADVTIPRPGRGPYYRKGLIVLGSAVGAGAKP